MSTARSGPDEEGLLKKRFLPLALSVLVHGARSIYAGMKLLPVQRKVVLITREPRQISVDFQLLQQEIRRSYPDYRIVVINHQKLSLAYIPMALREMYHLASCAGCLVDGYIIPVSILNHRKELQIGQIWHALGAIKRFGHLASGTLEGPTPEVAATMRMHQNYSFVCASGQVPAAIYTQAFGIPADRVRALGMPRIDYLLDAELMQQRRAEIVAAFPQLSSAAESAHMEPADQQRIVLYIPTFRRGRRIPYASLGRAFSRAAQNSGANPRLVILPHPNDRSPLPDDLEVVVGSGFSALDWLAVADVVITDYSAVVYEAALRDIPTVFWPYDIDHYQQARGLALDYAAHMPGPIVFSAAQAVRQSLEIGEVDYRAFRSQHLTFICEADGSLPASAPHCAQRIIQALKLEHMPTAASQKKAQVRKSGG